MNKAWNYEESIFSPNLFSPYNENMTANKIRSGTETRDCCVNSLQLAAYILLTAKDLEISGEECPARAAGVTPREIDDDE